MSQALTADTLIHHVRALADEIGPRPPGSPAEAQARGYIRDALARLGYAQVEAVPFTTVDEPVYGFFTSLLLSLAGGVLGELGGRAGKISRAGRPLRVGAAADAGWLIAPCSI